MTSDDEDDNDDDDDDDDDAGSDDDNSLYWQFLRSFPDVVCGKMQECVSIF